MFIQSLELAKQCHVPGLTDSGWRKGKEGEESGGGTSGMNVKNTKTSQGSFGSVAKLQLHHPKSLSSFFLLPFLVCPRAADLDIFPDLYGSSLHWEIRPGGLWGPFQELLEMTPSAGTSCLKTDDTAFSDCLIPIIRFALASSFLHCQYMQCFSQLFLPLGISVCYLCPFLSWYNHMLAKVKY